MRPGSCCWVCWVSRRGAVPAHIFLEQALFAKGIVASSWFLGEEAVEASWWAITWDGRVVAAAMSRVVFTLEVSTLSTDAAMFVHCQISGVCVCVMCK
jgi:hypothetical protein